MSPQPAAEPDVPEHCDLLLTGGCVITVDDQRRVLDPGFVAIRGDRIVAVDGTDHRPAPSADREVDCTGRILLPGLIDCHTHLFQGLLRTVDEPIPLWKWLSERMWPFAAAMSTRDGEISAFLGAIESARAGTTCLLDHHYLPADADSTLAVAAAIETVGLRGTVARGMAGMSTPVARSNKLPSELFPYSNEDELSITRQCMRERSADALVSVWPGPHNLVYSDWDLIRSSVQLARDEGTGWHSHLSNRAEDPAVFFDTYGLLPVEWLHQEGLLGPEAVFAHTLHVSDTEVELLGKGSSAGVYCPVSHELGAVGFFRLAELRAAGVTVALGTDGAGYCHRQDMFEVMKQAISVQRLRTLDATAAGSEDAIELATRDAANVMKLDAGALAPGKLADVTVIGTHHAHLRPIHRPVGAVANSVYGADVEMTIVGGRPIYEQGRCTFVDEEAVLEEAQDRAEALLARSGLGGVVPSWRRTSSGA